MSALEERMNVLRKKIASLTATYNKENKEPLGEGDKDALECLRLELAQCQRRLKEYQAQYDARN